MKNYSLQEITTTFLDDVCKNDLEILRVASYTLDYLINSISGNAETLQDKYNLPKLITCQITFDEILKEEATKK